MMSKQWNHGRLTGRYEMLDRVTQSEKEIKNAEIDWVQEQFALFMAGGQYAGESEMLSAVYRAWGLLSQLKSRMMLDGNATNEPSIQ